MLQCMAVTGFQREQPCHPYRNSPPLPGRWNEEVAAATEEAKRTRKALGEVQAGLATLVRGGGLAWHSRVGAVTRLRAGNDTHSEATLRPHECGCWVVQDESRQR